MDPVLNLTARSEEHIDIVPESIDVTEGRIHRLLKTAATHDDARTIPMLRRGATTVQRQTKHTKH